MMRVLLPLRRVMRTHAVAATLGNLFAPMVPRIIAFLEGRQGVAGRILAMNDPEAVAEKDGEDAERRQSPHYRA